MFTIIETPKSLKDVINNNLEIFDGTVKKKKGSDL